MPAFASAPERRHVVGASCGVATLVLIAGLTGAEGSPGNASRSAHQVEEPAENPAEEQPQDPVATREAMRAIFGELQVVLPAAVSGTLGDPARSAEFQTALHNMAEQAEDLTQHGSPLPAGSRVFAGALAQDIQRAETFFARKDFGTSSFLITAVVENCAACHTRQQSPDALISQNFISGDAFRQLDPLERAALLVATRRFEEGLSLYEETFAEPGTSAEVLLGPLSNYLTVALRVTRDPARAAQTVSKLAAAPSNAAEVQADLEHWKAVLENTQAQDLAGTTLDDARAAVFKASANQRYASDRRALVDFLVASAKLNDLSTQPQATPEDAAEIFELLGQTELGVAQSLWLSRADLYWENAIRTAPRAPAAERAFAKLEKEVHAGFTGSGGLRLPPEEATRLDELRALVTLDALAAADGGALFAQHCALCHGADGRGNGLFARELMWVPADLTRISARRDGRFPDQEVFGLIARRDPLGSHQSPEMPRWGQYWSDNAKIDALVSYLRTIQRP